MGRTLVVVVLLGLVGSAALGQRPPTAHQRREAKAHFQQGRAFYDAGAYDDAVREYERAYQLVPLPELLFNIGQAYRMKGDKARAMDSYQRYLNAAPEGPLADEARNHVALLRSRIQLEEAEAARQKAAAEAAAARKLAAEEAAARRRVETEAAARSRATTADEAQLRRLAEETERVRRAREDAALPPDVRPVQPRGTDVPRRAGLRLCLLGEWCVLRPVAGARRRGGGRRLSGLGLAVSAGAVAPRRARGARPHCTRRRVISPSVLRWESQKVPESISSSRSS